jgi:hypothetical protein
MFYKHIYLTRYHVNKHYLGLLLLFILVFSCQVSAASTCNHLIPESTPTSRFTDNLDGTVEDNVSGLIWAKCMYGETYNIGDNSCSGTATTRNWKQAVEFADASIHAGFNDWRLPNIKELQSIVERQCHTPAQNETLFPTGLYILWTSTPSSVDSDKAWYVLISRDGSADIKEKSWNAHRARFVRGRL